MSLARFSRWILFSCLALCAGLAASYVGWRAVTQVPAVDAQAHVLTANDMVESLLAQARQSQRQHGIATETSAMWVRVANPTPVTNANRRYLPRETCFIKKGEKVVLVRMEADQVLLRYRPRLLPSGSNCPDGTLFFVTAEKAAVVLPSESGSR